MSLFGAVADSYVASGGGATSYSDVVLADSPLVFYKFDDTSGPTAVDSSGNAHDAAYFGSPTLGATGLINDGGKAVTLSGSGQYVQLAHGTWMDSVGVTVAGDYTWELWIKTSATSGFLWSYDDGSTNKLADVQIISTGKVQVTTFHSTTGQNLTGTVTVNNNAPHHVVVVKSGLTMLIYVDGVLDTSGSFASYNSDFGFALTLNIGQRGNNSGRLAGTIDMAAYYGTALSSTRIAAHYAARV